MSGIDLGTLNARIRIDDREAQQDLQSFEDKAKNVGDTLATIGTVSTAMGTAGLIAIKKLLDAGAEWDAQIAGTDFILKNLDKTVSQTIVTNSKNAEAIGLTNQQYLDGASKLTSFYKNLGLTTDEMIKMSGESMTLVADLAAITDMPFDEALTRFKSGLMGNYEALDAFNINVSATSLSSSEFVKSLGKTWNKLSDTEKMMAVYNEVMRQGEVAQGLATQEAGQLAMQMKLLSTEISETAGVLGQTLIPIVAPLVTEIREVVKAIREWTTEHPKLAGVILASIGVTSALLLAIGALTLAVAGAIKTFLFWKPIILAVSTFLKTELTANLAIATLNFYMLKDSVLSAMSSMVMFMARIPLVSGIMNSMSGVVSSLMTSFLALSPFGKFKIVLAGIALVATAFALANTDLGKLTENISNTISKVISYLTENVPKWIEAGKNLIVGLARGLWENREQIFQAGIDILTYLKEGIVNGFPYLVTVAGDVFQYLLNGFVEILPLIYDMGLELLGKLTEGIVTAIPIVVSGITDVLVKLAGILEEYLPTFIRKGGEFIYNLVDGMWQALPTFLAGFTVIMQTLINSIIEYLPLIIEKGTELITWLIEGMVSALPMITETIISLINILVEAFVNNLDVIIQAGVNLLIALIEGIVEALPLIIDAGIQIITALITALIDNLPLILGAVLTLMLELAQAIIENLPLIIECGLKILMALIAGILTILPQLIQLAITLVVTLAQTLISNAPKMLSAGVQLVWALIKGLLSVLGGLLEAGAKLIISLLESIGKGASQMFKAGADLVGKVIDGIGSVLSSLVTAGGKIVSSILSGIKNSWGGVTSWVGDKLAQLKPFSLDFEDSQMEIGTTLDDSGVSAFNKLTRDGLSANPVSFGFSPSSRLLDFDLSTPKGSVINTNNYGEDESKEIVVNTNLIVDGYQIAKATAKHMVNEINTIDKRRARLGGVF